MIPPMSLRRLKVSVSMATLCEIHHQNDRYQNKQIGFDEFVKNCRDLGLPVDDMMAFGVTTDFVVDCTI